MDNAAIQEIANQLGIASDQVLNFAPEYGQMVFERALYGLIGIIIFTLISGIIVVRSATKTAKRIEAEKNTCSGDGYDKTMGYCAVTFVASVVFVISLVVLIISLFSFGDTLAWLNHPQAKLVETVIQQL